MNGILLDQPIEYLKASLRFFAEGEYHVTRICPDDVLLLVYEGCLRFVEDGIAHEISPGEYYIQHQKGAQRGDLPSGSPKYLYVHFKGTWADNGEHLLPRSGLFSYSKLKDLLYEADRLTYHDGLTIEKEANFYRILSALYHSGAETFPEQKIMEYIAANFNRNILSSELEAKFHFTKNHIIKAFKKRYKMTPIEYLNSERIKHAEYLLRVTSYPTEKIAELSGYNHYSHFYRNFVKKNGISPKAWRDAARNDLF